MADEPQEPSPPPAKPRKPATKANWMAVKPVAKASSRRLADMLALGAVCLVLLGVLLAVLMWPNGFEKPRVEILSLSEYADPLLPPAFAEQDADLLYETFSRESAKATKRFDTQQGDAIRRHFDDLAQAGEKVLVVYLRGLGRLDKGECRLLPAGAGNAAAGWLRLEELLTPLAGNNRALVILDLASPKFDPLAGPADAEFGKALHGLAKKLNEADSGLCFLLAAGPDEVSHVSEEWRSSVFAHYLARGLAGGADGSLDGSRNNRVSLAELARFVRHRVGRWAEKHGLAQHPVLVGDGNFDVAEYRMKPESEKPVAAEDEPEAKGKPAKPEFPYPAALLKLWQDVDDGFRLRDEPPELLRQRRQRAMRAELRWRGGRKAEDVLGTAPKDYAPPTPVHPAIPHAAAGMKEPAGGPAPEFLALVRLYREATEKEIVEADPKIKKYYEELHKRNYGELAWRVWNEVRREDREITVARLNLLDNLLTGYPPDREIGRLVETEHLHKMTNWMGLNFRDADEPLKAARPLLRTIAAIEQIAALPPAALGETWPRVRKAVEAARNAKVGLYNGTLKGPEAKRSLEELANELEREWQSATARAADAAIRRKAAWQLEGTVAHYRLLSRTADALKPDAMLLAMPGDAPRGTREAAWKRLREPFGSAALAGRLDNAAGGVNADALLRGWLLHADDGPPAPSPAQLSAQLPAQLPAKDGKAAPPESPGRVRLHEMVRAYYRDRHAEVLARDAEEEQASPDGKLPETEVFRPGLDFPNGDFAAGYAPTPDRPDWTTHEDRTNREARSILAGHYAADYAVFARDSMKAEFAGASACFDSLARGYR